MFANGGERVEPTLVDRVQDRWGNTIYRHDQRVCAECGDPNLEQGRAPRIASNRERVMDAVTAYQLTSMMEGVVERGTARRSGLISPDRLGALRPVGGFVVLCSTPLCAQRLTAMVGGRLTRQMLVFSSRLIALPVRGCPTAHLATTLCANASAMNPYSASPSTVDLQCLRICRCLTKYARLRLSV